MISLALRSVRATGIVSRAALVHGNLIRQNTYDVRKYSAAVDTVAKKKKGDLASHPAETTLDLIRENVASRERLKYALLNNYIESLNEPITTENISFLYECIARYLPQVPTSHKSELIAKLWTKVKFWKSPAQEDYVSWLRAMRECEVAVTWEDLQKELEHLEPTLKLYEELLYFVSSLGESEETVEILAHIKEQGFPLTEKVFNALIVAHSRDQNVASVESVLELMTVADLTPNAETQYEMAKAYINNGVWENSRDIIELADLNTRQLLDLLKSVLRTEEGASDEQLSFLIQKLPGDVQRHREISPVVKNLIIELIHIYQRPHDILRILKCLPKPPPSTENDDTYGAFLLNELIDTHQPFAVIKSICDFLVDEGRNTRAAFVATEMSLRRHSPHSMDLLRFLGTVEPLKPHYFWSLFIDEFQTNGEQGILNLIAEMKSLNVEVDADTISTYILPRSSLLLKDIKTGIQMMTDAGIKMNQLIEPLVQTLLATDRYDDFHFVLSTYPTKVSGDQILVPLVKSVHPKSVAKDVLKALKTLKELSQLPPNTDVNGSFLVEMANVGKFVPIQGIITEIHRHKIKISQTAKSRVEERIKTAKNLTPDLRAALLESFNKLATDSSVPLPGTAYLESKHPKDMNYDELESHLSELQGKQMNTRGVLRKILQMAVKEKRYEQALQWKQRCDEVSMDYSPGMVASCIELYTKLGKAAEAKEMWNTLETKFPNFTIDEHKAVDYANLLITLDQLGEARQILEKRAQSKMIGENNNKNVWNLLMTLSEKAIRMEEDHPTKSFLNFLVQLKYCKHTNTLLGPLVREWLLKKDLRRAVSEYKDIAKKYRKTPLNLELLTLLVGVKNGHTEEYGEFTENETMDMIADVYKAVELVHGLPAAKTSLLFATAEGGNDKQVRKILMDPSVRVDPQALQRQCEYLGRAGKTEPLFRLIKSSRGLSHNIINEQQLWCVLLQTLAKQNNIDEAVRLFDRLLEEDEFKVNKEIASIVIDLLKRNNLELPIRLQAFNV